MSRIAEQQYFNYQTIKPLTKGRFFSTSTIRLAHYTTAHLSWYQYWIKDDDLIEIKRYMQIQSVGQWAGQKQQGGRKIHTRGTPGDGLCQRNEPTSPRLWPHLQWSRLRCGMPDKLGCAKSYAQVLFWVFCVRRITFWHGHYSPWAACPQLKEGWTAQSDARNRGWNQKWGCSPACAHSTTQAHTGFHGRTHTNLFSKPSSGCSGPPDLCQLHSHTIGPHYEEVRKLVFSCTI